MSLTDAQKVTVAEITYETFDKIDSLASSLNADQEAAVIADIALWNARKNKVHIRLEGGRDGVKLVSDRLLEAITIRVRNAFGLSLIPSRLRPRARVFAGGLSVADMNSRSMDTDRPSSAFTRDLHES